ncbi:MAG: DUF1049 domain-containing protein [Dehalococcoidia bacterium]|nr:MAG: DUF1049 domain-containing protein [Dehalococcoidia bacterium]
MPPVKLIIGLIVATALVVFGAQNTQDVTFHFLMFETRPAPVLLAVFAAALAGALLAWIVSTPGRYRGMRQRRDLERQVTTAHRQTDAAVTEMEASRRPPPDEPPAQP